MKSGPAVVPKCCRKGGGYDFKRQRIVRKKIPGRKSGQAMAAPARPPTTALLVGIVTFEEESKSAGYIEL